MTCLPATCCPVRASDSKNLSQDALLCYSRNNKPHFSRVFPQAHYELVVRDMQDRYAGSSRRTNTLMKISSEMSLKKGNFLGLMGCGCLITGQVGEEDIDPPAIVTLFHKTHLNYAVREAK